MALELRVSLGKDAYSLLMRIKRVDADLILDKAAAVVLSRTRNRFRKMVDPDGNKWPESKAAKIRRAGGYTWSNGKKVTGGQTLFATGTLFHNITAYKKTGFIRGIGVPDRIKYAKYTQDGTPTSPQRKFLGINREDASMVTTVINRLGTKVFKT